MIYIPFIILLSLLISIIIYFKYTYSIDNYITYNNNIIPSDNLSDFCMQKILTPKEAEFFANKVKSHTKYWKTKNILMYILGTASYIEGTNGTEYYTKQYKKTNKFLYKHYKKLYKKILDYFQQRTNSTVKYRFAYPGFHIFKCNRLFSLPVASIHKDRQYLNLPLLKNEDIDYDKTLSFTLCLELPPTGGGLYKFQNNINTKVIYKPGYIVCHNGKTTHMIAPSPPPTDNNEYYRITLQGHGIYDKTKDIWWLYW
jgi:hypothetical protein